MTIYEFDERYWTSGMTCNYCGERRDIASVDFAEKLIGLKSLSDDGGIDMVRCENVNDVTCNECEPVPKPARGISMLYRFLR